MNLEGHTSTVVTLAIVDKMLFSGSMDGTLKVSYLISDIYFEIWDLNTFQPIREASLGPVFTLKVSGNLMFSGHVNVIKVTLHTKIKATGLGPPNIFLQVNASRLLFNYVS